MQSKSLLIAIAAFAVTTTGVNAYHNENLLEAAGLSEEQREAFEIAHELRSQGDKDAARDALLKAGIDETTLKSIHEAKKEKRKAGRGELDTILENKDYEAFKAFAADKPLSDIVITETDFEEFVDAHNLRLEGDREGAREIMEELGFGPRKHHDKGDRKGIFNQLSEEEKEAVMVAKSANDRETVKSILREAGVEI